MAKRKIVDAHHHLWDLIVASFSESEKDQLFRGNALRHYRLRAEA